MARGLRRDQAEAVERAERTSSIVAADRLTKALGTTLAEMPRELERNRNDPEGIDRG